MEYIRSPINFTGSKYKLLPSIIPLLPDNIHTFVDLFGGGFNVGVNVNAERIWYNDSCIKFGELLWKFKHDDTDTILKNIDGIIKNYSLSKTNQDGFLELRWDYNTSLYKYSLVFYVLMCYSFNNQFRFNSKGEYNMPFGKREFNTRLRNRLVKFCQELKKKDIDFYTCDFRRFLNSYVLFLGENDFVYADPPYLNSVATYNENGGWTEEDEQKLHKWLDFIDERGVKFALSGNLKYDNPYLKEWMNKYYVHYLNADYNNCNYQKKDKSKDCEVLITNYEKER